MVGSEQRAKDQKSGGMRIDDHKFFGGSGSPRFPDGPHKTKEESSAEGAGSLMKYEDTTEAIKNAQIAGVKQAKSHPLKSGTRN